MYGVGTNRGRSPRRRSRELNRKKNSSSPKPSAGTDGNPARARAGTTVAASRSKQRFDEAFEYGEFISNWQDQIKLRHYDACERFCRAMIAKLKTAEDDPTLTREQSEMNRDNRAKVHFSLAYLLKKYSNRPDDARLEYEQCLRFDPDNPGAHFNLANLFVDAFNDYKKAEHHFRLAIRLEPTFALYRMTYAEFLWQNCQRHSDAKAQYEEIIRLKPDDVNVRFNFGLLLRDHLQLYPQAIHQLQRATELSPNDAEAREEFLATKEMGERFEQQQRELGVEAGGTEEQVTPDDPAFKPPWGLMKMSSGSWRRSAHDVMDDAGGYNSQRGSINARSSSARKSVELARLKNLLEEHNDLLDNISIREESFIDQIVENGVDSLNENADDVLAILGKMKHILDNWPGRD